MNRYKITRPVLSQGAGVTNATEYAIVEAPAKPTPRGVVSVDLVDVATPLTPIGEFIPLTNEDGSAASATPAHVTVPAGGN